MKKAVVIGAGVAGLAASIRLALKGYAVVVLESNTYAGGKLTAFRCDGFRFDAGPSLFTMPQYVDELFELAGKNPRDYFNFQKLETLCHYFFPSGTQVRALSDREKCIENYAKAFGESSQQIQKYFDYSENIYEITHRVFLEKSLHKLTTYLSFETLKSFLRIGEIDAFRTQHAANQSFFKNQELVQLFDRYATYNGSNPYQAPATLNVIPYFENGFGAYLPKGGMHAITQSLQNLAVELGVVFQFNTQATQIKLKGKEAVGVVCKEAYFDADVVFSNADVWFTYQKLLHTQVSMPNTLKKQERSSSALIFYWGMDVDFHELGVHNIFFSTDYKKEFEAIFEKKTLVQDPTVYINITSKIEKQDAPEGNENWFVMINVPHDSGQDWQELQKIAKENIIIKLEKILKKEVKKHIVCEETLNPTQIESKTGSFLGSLYGSSSNDKFAAFLRHPNFIPSVKNLYCCGGSVHPGGGIPLALLSAKIAVDQLKN